MKNPLRFPADLPAPGATGCTSHVAGADRRRPDHLHRPWRWLSHPVRPRHHRRLRRWTAAVRTGGAGGAPAHGAFPLRLPGDTRAAPLDRGDAGRCPCRAPGSPGHRARGRVRGLRRRHLRVPAGDPPPDPGDGTGPAVDERAGSAPRARRAASSAGALPVALGEPDVAGAHLPDPLHRHLDDGRTGRPATVRVRPRRLDAELDSIFPVRPRLDGVMFETSSWAWSRLPRSHRWRHRTARRAAPRGLRPRRRAPAVPSAAWP